MDIRIFNKEDKTNVLANTVAFGYEITKEINRIPSINFLLSRYDETWRLLEAEGYIESADGLFVIKDITINDDEVEVYAVYDVEIFQYTEHFRTGQVTASFAGQIRQIIDRTVLRAWTCEHHIAAGVQPASVTINWTIYEPLSCYDAVQEVTNIFNGEFVFDNINKVIHIYEARHCGEYRGAYIIEGFNLADSSISISTDDIVTRLWAYGKDDIDISSVNPTRMEYIENFAYTDKVIEATWKDERYEIPQNLYDAAVALLAERSQPVVNFSLSMADMYAITGNSNFYIEVGDTVRLSIDGNESEQVVVKLTNAEDDLENTAIELASKAGSLLDTIASLENKTISGSGGGGGSTSWDAITGKPTTFPPSAHNHDERYYTETEVNTLLDEKQDALVSGSNIKTINGESILGGGNIVIQGGGGTPSLACCSANNTSTGTVATSANKTKVTLNRFNVNTDESAFEFENGGIKCKKAGVVQINASIYIRVGSSSAAAGTSGCYITLNGVDTELASNYSYTNNAYNTKGCTKIINVSANDIIYLVSRTSAAGLCYPGNSATYLEATYLA